MKTDDRWFAVCCCLVGLGAVWPCDTGYELSDDGLMVYGTVLARNVLASRPMMACYLLGRDREGPLTAC